MKVCFYSEGHIGDLLIPLPIIDTLIKQYPDNEYYHYDKGGGGVCFNHDLIGVVDNLIPTSNLSGDIIIPTWAPNEQYLEFRNKLQPDHFFVDHFSGIKYFLTNIFSKYGLGVKVSDDCGINFDYKIPNEVKKTIQNFTFKLKINILFFNQSPNSGQTDSIDYSNFLIDISKKYPNYNFFYTNGKSLLGQYKNLHYTPDVFGIHSCDILYNAYLSKYCNFLVGRVSGPFMFSSMHNMNVLDDKKIIISQHNGCGGLNDDLEIFYNKKIYKANNIHSKSTDLTFKKIDQILSTI